MILSPVPQQTNGLPDALEEGCRAAHAALHDPGTVMQGYTHCPTALLGPERSVT